MSIMDNAAIERIATPDLAGDTLELLGRYGASDDVVFFLGRLVWQGKMIDCVPALMDIACDPERERYARLISIRGAMSVGDAGQKDRLWETIASQPGPLDWDLLGELLEWAAPTMHSVNLLLRTLERVAPFERFKVTGLEQAFHTFVDRLPLMADEIEDHPLGRLIVGLSGFLDREPFVQRGECHVSEEFAWLMPAALHAVDRLVAARSAQALLPAPIAIMRNMPALRHWRSGDFSNYKSSLDKNVPRWPELNDLLYWTSVATHRASLARKNQALVDDWQIAFLGHFWSFGAADFERCLDWVNNRENADDRLVALSRCVQLFIQADRPATWLRSLRAAVEGDQRFESALETALDSKPSPTLQAMEAKDRKWKREREARKRKEEQGRADWVRGLKENPDRVHHPIGLKPGDFSQDQFHLLLSATENRSATNRDDGANWRKLIPEFGEPVARAYRDAAVAHWRVYSPGLRSEGADTSAISYSLVFAMTGLAIETGEDSAFAQTRMSG